MTDAVWIRKIQEGAFDATLSKLYAEDAASIEKQRRRYVQAIESFGQIFGKDREIRLYSAPGRTEIGGNHTDHNNGVVMAAAVNLDILCVVSKSEKSVVRLKSRGFDKLDSVDLTTLTPVAAEKERSAALIRGVAAGISQQGGKVGGWDCYSTSDVLRGSGLSSSAAFEVVVGAIFRGEYNNDDYNLLSQVELAKIGQYAENVYFGKPCGLMDQTACAVGSAITIDFRDPKDPIVQKVGFDLAKHGYVLCISDTKGSHADLTDDYASIRREMESVAECFGKPVLRDVDENAFYQAIPSIRAKVGDRAILRAIHFFNDCRRAGELYRAVSEDRFEDFLQGIMEGGHSSFEYNQNAYSIKHPAQQGVALGLAISQRVLQGRGAWRLQGGGFAGTIQAFVPNDLLEEYRGAIDSVFGEGSCYVLSVRNWGTIQINEEI